jgi:hypothetical protein
LVDFQLAGFNLSALGRTEPSSAAGWIEPNKLKHHT